MVILCKGHYQGEMFYPISIEQPPQYNHKVREINFKPNQNDYFGAYTKLHKELASLSVRNASEEIVASIQQTNIDQS